MEDTLFYYLYEMRNNINGKIYVGVHKTKNLDDGYVGSGRIIKQAIEKYGIHSFTKTILEFFDSSDVMYTREREYVNSEFLSRGDVYNLRRGGSGGFDYINTSGVDKFKGKRHTEATKRRISKSSAGKIISEETKQRQSDNNWAKTNPLAHKKHVTDISTGRVKSANEGEKISACMTALHATGAKKYNHLIGNKFNSGKRWIHCGSSQRMINKHDLLPDGWQEGRK